MKRKNHIESNRCQRKKELSIDPTYENSYEPIAELELAMDVKTTIDSLPQIEKNICLMLMNEEPIRKICIELKISHDDFKNIYAPKIKERFLEYGFEEHELHYGF